MLEGGERAHAGNPMKREYPHGTWKGGHGWQGGNVGNVGSINETQFAHIARPKKDWSAMCRPRGTL
jgi:hypothetical protein